jgi:Fe-S oxidoreductase
VHRRSGAALGNDLAFGQLAESNLETLKQSKVKKIVSICPHCVRTIGTDWRRVRQAPPVEHHSEFLARHLDQLPAKTANGREDRLSRSLLSGPLSQRVR